MASLCLALVAYVMPAWTIGSGLVLAGEASGVLSQTFRIALLLVGASATLVAARTAIVLSRAPRLGRRHYRRTLRYAAVIVAVLTLGFVVRAITTAGGLGGDVLLSITACAPAVLMAELAFALPVIGGGRHGTTIGNLGGYLWSVAAIAAAATALLPHLWWIAPVLAASGTACTAPAAIRLWRRYEAERIGG